jgi:phosphopantothenoylcysteine decarboxylase / phosphopantothenate---cysteine ligase
MSLREKKVIVTGGPTREWLDPVRFISNPSTGKMGVAIADASLARARETVFIHGPIDTSLVQMKKYRCVSVETTMDMLGAVMKELEDSAVLIMAAAPADYSPVSRSDRKIKKSDKNISIELAKTPDILKEVAAMKLVGTIRNLFTVGFAAETNDIEEYALKKLSEKNLDMICLNDVSRHGAGFGTDTNIVTIFIKDGSRKDLPMISKQEVAARILDEIEARLPRYLLST